MSDTRVFRRKIYDRMLQWKKERDGKTALLVKGARRIGKSTIVEEFARQEYDSYLLIDFARASEEVKSLFNDSNHVQLSAARAMGFQPIRSLRDARRLSRPLVKVESCPYYVVDSLTSSVPYLIPRAASLLADIGREFADSVRARGGHEYRIRITSLTRTHFSVNRLRRRNINATEQSCHLFGTTFDISWVKFQNLDPDFIVSLEDLKNLLAEIIYNKRRQGLCYAKFEVKQGCFHITTR